MFSNRAHERLRGRSLPQKQDHTFLLKGQQIQVNSENDANLTTSFSFCSCKCRCHQCSGELAESLSSLVQDLQNKNDKVKLQETAPQESFAPDTASHNTESERLKRVLKEQETIVESHQNCSPLLDDLACQVKKLTSTIKTLEEEMAEDKAMHKHQVQSLQDQIKETIDNCEAKIAQRCKELEELHKLRIEVLKERHRKETLEKDAKIEMLKGRVVQSFDTNARERRGQIDELVREVKRASNEAAVAQTSLSELRLQRMKEKDKCLQCETLKKEVEFLQQMVHERDITIGDLDAVCSKMRNQLIFQGEINDLLLKSKDTR